MYGQLVGPAFPAKSGGMPDNLCPASPEEQNRYNFDGESDTSTVYRRPNCGMNRMVKYGDSYECIRI
jgi:hypothetical protein